MTGADDTIAPVISVVIPAYNASRTIAETLQHAAAQTFRNLEILVVDDGSTDDTRAIAAAMAAHDPRMQILHKPNGGVASARNVGLHAARGHFVAFLDADDLWHPDHLNLLHQRLLETGARLVFSGFRRIDASSRLIGDAPIPEMWGRGLARMYYRNVVGNGSALLVERRLALRVGGFAIEPRQRGAEGSEDYLFQLRCAAIGPIASLQAWTVGYRWSPGSMSTRELQMSRSLRMTLASIAAECPAERWLSTVHRWRVARDDIRMASWWLANGRPLYAIARMLRAPLRDPVAAYAAVRDRLRGRTSIVPATLRPFSTVDPKEDSSPLAQNHTARLHERRWKWVEQKDQRAFSKQFHPVSQPGSER